MLEYVPHMYVSVHLFFNRYMALFVVAALFLQVPASCAPIFKDTLTLLATTPINLGVCENFLKFSNLLC